MKSFYQTIFLLISIAFFTKAQEPDRSFKTSTITASGKRTALVIGNAAYQYTNPLKNPLNDANAMEATLKDLGFEVKKLANANRSLLKEAINQWGKTLVNYDVALFFYAGHALEIDGTNFLCPVNANPLNRAQVEDETVTMRMVMGWMEESRTKTNIILLDACRDNPFRSFRSNEGGLANMSAPSGTFIGFAATPGKKASDGDLTNGLYTEAILKAIKTPNQTIDQSFNQVNAYVRNASGGTQVPFKNSSLEADFYFVVNSVEATVKGNASNREQLKFEDLLNQGVEATNKNDRKKAVELFKKAGALANGFGLSDEKSGILYEQFSKKGDKYVGYEEYATAKEWYGVAQSLRDDEVIRTKISQCNSKL
jgi:uncharacterized caspase-like protein